VAPAGGQGGGLGGGQGGARAPAYLLSNSCTRS
jgi:hypothetical protein